MAERNTFYKARQKYLSHPMQGIGAYFLFGVFRVLPIDLASAIGGWLLRKIGPKIGQTKKARNNLIKAFPEKSPEEIEAIITDMWENLGRSVAEIPHLPYLKCGTPRLEVVGLENGLATKDDDKPGLFFTGHMGNWEVSTKISDALDLDMMTIYRAPDNPWVDRLFKSVRKGFRGELVPKGAPGARKYAAFLKKGGHAAMLVDQKLNNGIAVPFFGRDAMTAPALAQFALRYECPVIPVRIERLDGAHFRMTFYPDLNITKTDDPKADNLRVMTEVNAIMESWIRERPAQWLWLHKRWPS
ncbi:lauroyl acyltransferase [Thalassospira alkalitolerans]|uniref:Lauroyl acyltransferase n=1 Tax=Thalassospira alkalitolerans TaxID=1293890 RepID=A0A1Y2L7I3_9PROT|nr:lauroyl acyltransferase [Thalassospira alkalitolerans]OSQ44302.1 lauroyl acyltransferase [Thalassospira alkalitolerans]|tara:strand:- start:21110 stop:22009 length:900 start_codon:yes stop_codon:yes gene_type:complete